MARLPVPGGDKGNWGTILNEYLSQALKPDGTIKDNAVTSNNLAPNSVTNTALASNAVNAATIEDGSISEVLLSPAVQVKLNGGVAPDWAAITNKPTIIAAGADQATARSAIGAGTSSSSVVNITNAVTFGNTANMQYVILLGAGAVPTLPTAVTNSSIYIIKNVHTAAIAVLTTSSQTVEGQSGYLLSANESIMIVSDGTNWRII